ncbi:MAG TPA: MBOAT family O-acyltransferase [Bacteroidales bacterium]|nr:MBOAT family O-acyltransferase [Bacteroidales bacterium]
MQVLKNIFLFSQDAPLIFTQVYFWGFFAVVLAVYSIVYKKRTVRNSYLFLISLFFYYKTSGLFFLLLVFSTIVDYIIGISLHKTSKPLSRKLLVTTSIVVNIGMLSYYKYSYFFTDLINQLFHLNLQVKDYIAMWSNMFSGTHFDVDKILLPVGISFFTFQTISYSIDVYRRKVEPVRNILDFGFYVSFFPQLVAGPIVRASEFVPQLYKKFSLSKQEFGYALFLILNGLFKKMVISDYVAVNFIDRIFANPHSYTGFENLMALYGYSLQVYCDFSGYTDIAIGIALLMGFRLPTNFNSPYKAVNVGDFWKRWHMSLSLWLKDYLYIPLGGNRHGNMRTNINLMITMLLGGLWHGADMKFILWGGLNGMGLLVYKWWRKISPYDKNRTWPVRFWKILLTFNFITFTRIFFRSDDMIRARAMLQQLTHHLDFSVALNVLKSYWIVFAVMFFGYLMHWLPSSLKELYRGWFIRTPVYVKVIISVVIVFIIYQARSANLQPFIYFQF